MECAITFSNIAQSPDSNSTTAQTRDNHSARGPWKKPNSGNNALRPSVSSPRQGPNASVPRHRNTASLNRLRSRTSAAPGSSTQDHRQPDQVTTNGGHKRSVSIVSIAGDPTSTETKSHGIPASRRAGKGHGRAASLQILPGRSTVSTKSPSSGTYPFEPSVSMQRYSSASAYDPAAKKPAIFRSSTSSTLGNAQNAPELQSPSEEPASSLILTRPHGRTPSAGFSSSPRATQIPSSPATNVQPTPNKSTNDALGIRNLPQPPMQDQPNQVLDARGYLPRIFSSASNESTPRSSTHLYSASNNSSDTLASEYVNAEIGRGSHQPIPRQQRSQALPSKSRRAPEVLMMGYGSVVGNFNLDASLVNLTPFDEVKGKAVIGNQGGGGVVRAGSTKRQSGLLGSLGWSTLGESLGGLLGASEMSTIKEAVKSTDAKWFPLLSTPQSLLFTDLRLEPGRSQSYSFTYRLPPGLPPTYKGKALRVSYNLVIGVQRATQSTQQHLVRSVEFPFRVFPSVNGMAS